MINRQIEYLNNGREIVRPFGPSLYKSTISDEVFDILNNWIDDATESDRLDYTNYLFPEFGEDTQRLTASYTLDKKFHENEIVMNEIYSHLSYYMGMYENTPVEILPEKYKNQFHVMNFWVNIQSGYQWQPKHNHGSDLSFIIYMKIPSKDGVTSFEYGEQLNGSGDVYRNVPEEKEILIFPAWLKHQAYPIMSDEESRITIAGNSDILVKKNNGKDKFDILKNV